MTRILVLAMAVGLSTAAAQAADRQTQWEKRHHEILQGALPCVGSFTLDVWSQLRIAVATDDHGGLHVQVHFNTSSLNLTDESGAEYTGIHQIQNSVYVPPDSGVARTQTEVSNIRLMGQGSAPDLMVFHRLVVAVSAQGEVTADHQLDRVECSEE